ncbi:hypothetical protein BDM02DRAFT_3124011 [Thelephora ganbajun]|uniref:Uncharacterized protein n=1 Tax=Thelephora ganbajun TaxID=370292 RepID=A0ACB6YZY2_THEGA|nr:hypothetical protein BDM02DRAFT_3124011 [Thelephora ganbajun]
MAQSMNKQGEILGDVVVTVLDGQQEMCAEAIIEINLTNASQHWAEIPVPICEARVGGPPRVSATPL